MTSENGKTLLTAITDFANILFHLDVPHVFQFTTDMQLHFSCKLKDVDTLVSVFIACTDELSAWMKSNRLKLKCDKTECIWITSAQRQRTFVASTVTVGGASVCPSSGAGNLGVYFKSIKFETAYLQCYQKLLFSAAVTTCCPPFTAIRHPENSAPGIHNMPAGLLQLVGSGTTGLWCQLSTICSECSMF